MLGLVVQIRILIEFVIAWSISTPIWGRLQQSKLSRLQDSNHLGIEANNSIGCSRINVRKRNRVCAETRLCTSEINFSSYDIKGRFIKMAKVAANFCNEGVSGTSFSLKIMQKKNGEAVNDQQPIGNQRLLILKARPSLWNYFKE